MRKPSNNEVTLKFGAYGEAGYTKESPHKGVDFGHSPDPNIYAPFSGKVTQVPLNGNDGNGTYMTDPQGRYHGLLHASKYLVPDGSTVQEGQAIAVMGETGLAQGVHLHWAVKQNGQFIDGLTLVNQVSEEYIMNEEDAKQLFTSIYHQVPASRDQYAGWVGKYTRDQAKAERDTAPWRIQNQAVTFYDQVVAQRDEALAQLKSAQGGKVDPAKVDALVKQTDDLEQEIKKLKG